MPGAKRGYQIEDLYRIKTVSDAQISPDGRQVAYVVAELDREADAARSAIWLVEKDGGEPRPFTAAGRNDGQPRWSPDGRQLAFVSNREAATPQLYVLSIAGGEARRLTNFPRGVHEFAWAPDGARVAVVARVGGPEGSREQREALPRVVSSLRHKFNGQGFFDGSRRHIFLVDLAGGEARQLTDGDFDDGELAWAPDGSAIAFVSARHETRDRDTSQDLWIVAVTGGEPRPLTERFGPCHAPSFSPDSAAVAFVGHTDANDVGGRTNFLWVVPASGGTPRNLTAGFDRSIQAGPLNPGAPPAGFAWTPDGAAIVARVQDGADVHLYRIAVSDGSRTRLVGGERAVESFSTATDGSLAGIASDARHPGEVIATAPDGSQERRLTCTNDELLQELCFPEIEPVQVTTPDGACIEGWVIKPLDLQSGRRYPLVLDVHGGPHGAFLHAFRAGYPLALATRGCGVLQMNPRGSTGWGEEFARYLHGGRGERDLPELLAAVEQVAAQDWVDTERLGVTGYSYGGYMTAWAISQTDRFKAAVWGAGTANLYTHFSYSDINVPRYAEMQGSPWEQRELYLRQSPLSYVQNIKTPLLMLHGEADLRCNIAQADEFFTALKYFGVETMLVRYPGENHMMLSQGKPSNRLDYARRLIDWFSERLCVGKSTA